MSQSLILRQLYLNELAQKQERMTRITQKSHTIQLLTILTHLAYRANGNKL